MPFTNASRVISAALDRQAFSAAAVEVGHTGGTRWRQAFGALALGAAAPRTRPETIFDLASLTKVLCTATLAMRLLDEGRIRLNDPVARWIPAWRGEERVGVTLEDLLSHSSGLPGWLPLFRTVAGTEAFLSEIARTPLEYRPRTASIYSDLGFILLAFILERAAGASLDRLFVDLRSRLDLGDLMFLPPGDWKPRTAATEWDPWRGHLLVGEVHDENAAALGGVAGHAGLFGEVSAVGRFARWMLRARSEDSDACARLAARPTVVRFTTRGNVPGSSRALGWDMMLPTSSCGTRLSSAAFGHTGFTGTSLWIDPLKDLYVVLLTNFVRPPEEKQQLRRAFHDAVVDDLSRP